MDKTRLVAFRRMARADAKSTHKSAGLLVDFSIGAISSGIDTWRKRGWNDMQDFLISLAIGLGVVVVYELYRWLKHVYVDTPVELYHKAIKERDDAQAEAARAVAQIAVVMQNARDMEISRAEQQRHDEEQASVAREQRRIDRDRRLVQRLLKEHAKGMGLYAEVITPQRLLPWIKDSGRWLGRNEYMVKSRLNSRYATEVSKCLLSGKRAQVSGAMTTIDHNLKVVLALKVPAYRDLAQTLQRDVEERATRLASRTASPSRP